MDRVKRSKGGCHRCREKKLKCDETKPSCQRCIGGDVECPGYPNLIRWSRKHEIATLSTDEAGVNGRQQYKARRRASQTSQTWRNQSTSSQTSTIILQNNPAVDEQQVDDPFVSPIQVEQGPELAAPNVVVTTSPTATDQSQHSQHSVEQNQDFGSDSIALSNFSFVLPDNGDSHHGPEGGLNDTTSPLSAVSNLHLSPDSRLDEQDFEPFSDRGRFFKHFFHIICPLQCIFPQSDNVFLRLATRYLSTSSLIRKCVLCISASHYSQLNSSAVDGLVDLFSNSVTALLDCIKELEISENTSGNQSLRPPASEKVHGDRIVEALFASILLGLYSSYRDPEDLGLLHLKGARKLFQWWIQHHTRSDDVVADLALNEENGFIIGAMAWWEAHSAFVTDQALDSIDYLEPFICDQVIMTVHPFTGLSTPIFIILAQVGTCIRQQRLLKKIQKLSWPEEALRSMHMQLAERTIRLERWLLDFVFPKIENVGGLEHSESPSSPYRELICYGQIYQLVSLLELYRNFPSLDSSFNYPSPRPFGSVNLSVSPPQDYYQFGQIVNRQIERQEVFNSLAMTLFNLIEELPDAHESRLHQTLAYLISGSMLHLPASIDHHSQSEAGAMSLPWSNLRSKLAAISGRTESILRWRKLIMRKLQVNENSFGMKTVYKRAEGILENVWTKVMSPGQWTEADPYSQLLSGPYWVDVMEEYRLETNFA